MSRNEIAPKAVSSIEYALPNLYRDPPPDPALAESISRKYQELGGASGILGSPVSEAQGTQDGGASQNFQKGIILAHRSSGTHALYDPIWHKWLSLGGIHELGYPETDIMTIPGMLAATAPYWSQFQRGFIYSFPSGGMVNGYARATRVVRGAVFDKWKSMGGI
ncbi:hypothetical protein GK047_12865 [Paenibacillus sp. SYP-B3998]|uniref:Uncharacterized protein n=1 Tax=Paenibacillus sp. SYP-B3998 TaxID=2678564 RepID=A0A6G3ZYX3_9BACL|nr:hypothetical protein [Paenibacillus sp. SYP-B3998]NEW06894.1 hypothetical protein [Paenibacillus sp. SYP-B3998]